jgi:ArsR family transcriptional regulator
MYEETSMTVNARSIPIVEVGTCCSPVTGGVLGDDDASQLASLLGALADPVRLKMFSMIAANGEVCSCDLEEPLGKSQPTVSHHTRILAAAGLIEGRKQGRWMMWRIVPEQLQALRAALG